MKKTHTKPQPKKSKPEPQWVSNLRGMVAMEKIAEQAAIMEKQQFLASVLCAHQKPAKDEHERHLQYAGALVAAGTLMKPWLKKNGLDTQFPTGGTHAN